MKKLNIGMIGCGMIATQKHLPNLKKLEAVNLKAFASRTFKSALKAKETFGSSDSIAYENPIDLIHDPTLDVIHICTSNQSHADYTIKALNAGKHVMVEKPMATNKADAQAMLDAEKSSQKSLSVAYQNRFNEKVKALKALIDEGRLGEIYYAKAYAVRRRGIPTWGTFLDKTIQGGGPLIDVGSHVLDLVLWLMNDYDVDYVVGSTYQKLKDDSPAGNLWGPWDPKTFTVEDSAVGFIKMKSGTTIIIESSYALNTQHPKENALTLHGTLAGADLSDTLILNYAKDNKLLTEIVHPPYQGDAGFLEMQSWIQSLQENKAPLVTAEQAFKVTEIIDALYASADTNQPVYFK